MTDLGKIDIAENFFYRAIRVQPHYAAPYHNLGVLFTNLNRLEEAETCFCTALTLKPNDVQTEFSLATLYLLQGEYKKGWEKYDASRMVQHRRMQPSIPRWNGEDLQGKKIALYYEQGFGDTLQFVRYAALVAQLAAYTVLWVQVPLQRLLQTSFPALEEIHGIENVNTIPPDDFDFSCPMPSLPLLFHTSAQTIPQSVPYITVSPDLIAKWERIVKAAHPHGNYRVGIVWAGNPDHHNDHNRSMELADLADLFTLDRVQWISLQLGAKVRELDAYAGTIYDYHTELTDFAETAGLMTQLDLIITVDTAVAHLAGAMGKRTWVLLPFAPDWRWQLEREDSPWYPSVRLFRQQEPGIWKDVIDKVQLSLQKICHCLL